MTRNGGTSERFGKMYGLLATKLRRPLVPARRVPRLHLLQRLNEGLAGGRPVTLVAAPAGFGKTTCIGEWLDGLEGWAVAWLSLDPADDDPVRFFSYLVAALQKVDDRLGRDLEVVLRAGQVPPGKVVAALLANDLQGWVGRCVLILDDFHVIQDAAILEVLETLLAHLPATLHLVLLTREDPSLPLARLRLNNQLTEIRARDLRFSAADAGLFLNDVMGLDLAPADVAVLADRTEGWIAGLKLAGLSIRDQADPAAFIAGLGGSHHFILSYLSEQVLSRQPDDVRQFLLQTSIVERMNGELCDAVTGRTDSHAVLERLHSANLFLIPLGASRDEGAWYRYHHLFAGFLENRLRQTVPAEAIQELHRRAGAWLAANGLLDEAVRQALEGKEYERAVSYVEEMAHTTMYAGRMQALGTWLRCLPEAALYGHPLLSIHRAWFELLQETIAPPDGARPSAPRHDRPQVEMMVALCRFVALSENPSRTRRWAEQILASAPEGDLLSRTRAHSALAFVHLLEGRAARARQAYETSRHLALAVGNYSLLTHSTLVMALAECSEGRLRQAAGDYRFLVELEEEAGQEMTSLAGQGYVGLASIYLEANDLETAASYLARGLELCGPGSLAAMLLGHATRSRLSQARQIAAVGVEAWPALASTGTSPSGRGMAGEEAARSPAPVAQAQAALAWLSRPAGGPPGSRLPALIAQDVAVVLARVLLAQGEAEGALQVLDGLQATARCAIDVHLLRALARQKQGGGSVTPAALDSLDKALAVAEEEGYVLTFLEQGPDLIPLLRAAAGRADAPQEIKSHARKLLAAFPGAATTEAPGASRAGLVELLTARELEVLTLVAAGASNRAIADRLVISVSAVKKHTGNVYGKLGVGSRTQAVARARQLGLLSGE